ncbi:MAG: DUF1015 domain-containing protein [Dehalococcoidia bacterium]|nr:DUF1015 domain-containing protein [Dehalococcoidia bacterium]MDP7240401.1 DUF1015 domain-containing protein [Dehalococcoidia bacterium]MDP7470476.1 DUF1015 domain-containing protein [Dehalococcoidia bacterium]
MVEVRPFRGLKYNLEMVNACGDVLCPPYDVIPPAEKRACMARSPYNIVHLELGGGNGDNDRYTKAARTLKEWQETDVLVRDNDRALYLYDHHFQFQGCNHRRRGIMAAVRLDTGGIMPHESTHAAARQDRLQLLRATRTQISPIFVLYDDPGSQVAPVMEVVSQGPPLLEAVTPGEVHRLWRIAGTETVSALCRHLGAGPLIIADGHHRFECARAYRQERRPEGAGAWDFTMMVMVATDDPGLLIRPVHRMVRGMDTEWLGGLQGKLAADFEVESMPVEGRMPEGLLNLLGGGDIGVLGATPGRVQLLHRSPSASRPLPTGGGSLSVELLHQLVLEEVPGADIIYTHEVEEVVRRLGEFQIAFLVPAVSPSEVYSVARAGKKLPGKSTYFQPKIPTGLVLFPVDGEL